MKRENPLVSSQGASTQELNGDHAFTRILADAADSPNYWTGWHDGRASGLEVGWQRGHEAGQRAASVELAREWLAELATESARLAAGTSNRHGPAWRALVLNAEDAA